MKTFKVLGALLTYPEAALVADVRELRQALIAEGLLSRGELREVELLLDRLEAEELLTLQEAYVGLFDRSRSLSLHLFEHVHGDSRDRGQAMVDLAALYRRNGLVIAERELPDFLPLFLEFLSVVSQGEACAMLADTAHILARLETRLQRRASPYAGVLRALRSLAGAPAETEVAPEPDDDSPAAIDRAWEEAPVAFGGPGADPAAGGQGCPLAATAARSANTSALGIDHA